MIKMLLILLLGSILIMSNGLYAKKVIQYKQYEKFDLSDLTINGKVSAPGDLSVKERSLSDFDYQYKEVETFNNKTIKDIKEIK